MEGWCVLPWTTVKHVYFYYGVSLDKLACMSLDNLPSSQLYPSMGQDQITFDQSRTLDVKSKLEILYS